MVDTTRADVLRARMVANLGRRVTGRTARTLPYENAARDLRAVRPGPTNRQDAEILGIPKGTVDTWLWHLQRAGELEARGLTHVRACAASIRAAEILRPAIVEQLPNVIVAHNHPSGDPEPSPEDEHVTRRLAEAAELHDIRVLDHVVIGDHGFVSMAKRGMGGLPA